MALENMSSPSEYDHKYGQRLSRLETEVSNLDAKIDSVASAVKDIANNISQMQKAPWQTMLTAGSLIITIVSVIGLLALQPINAALIRHDNHISEITTLQNEHLIQQAADFARLSTQNEYLEKEVEKQKE